MQQTAGGFQSSAQVSRLTDLATAAVSILDAPAPHDPTNQTGSVGSMTVVGPATTQPPAKPVQPPVKQPTMQTTINFQTKERENADMAVGYFLFELGLPFNTVEGGAFIRLVEALKKVSFTCVWACQLL
jgi:hypothetical protein